RLSFGQADIDGAQVVTQAFAGRFQHGLLACPTALEQRVSFVRGCVVDVFVFGWMSDAGQQIAVIPHALEGLDVNTDPIAPAYGASYPLIRMGQIESWAARQIRLAMCAK
ncbi:MAG: hypothetical protein ABI870_12010, partial [Rhodanobacter sp.]